MPQLSFGHHLLSVRSRCRRNENDEIRASNRDRLFAQSRQETRKYTLIRTFPNNLTAKMFSYQVKPNFAVENEKAIAAPPTVSFDKPAAAPAPATSSPAPAK